jgi:ubiquinone/menaquinone biosynthesis C-methylase UbiE
LSNYTVPIEKSEETHWEKAAKTKMGQYLTKIETDFISEAFSLDKDDVTIMDVGAEAGRFSLLAKNKNATVVSIDIDCYSLKRLKRKNRNVHIIQADARKLPIKNEVFDVIFMIEVLDYINELQTAFVECKRALKPSSSCFLSFGNKSSIKSKIKQTRGQAYRHSYRNVVKCLNTSGFEIKKKTGYSWILFGRTSENKLLPVLAKFEKYIGLRKIPRFSPWVIVHVTKEPLPNLP